MSATIIDSLVVMLGLDSGDLEAKSPAAIKSLDKLEKQGDKTEKSFGKIGRTSKDTAHNVQNLTRVVGSFLAVIGGAAAIKAFVSDFIDSNAQLERLSKNLNISVPTISAWSQATEKLGGSAEGLQGTLDMLSKSQTQLMITGESNLIPYMSALGISLADVNGKARPVTDILLDLSDRFSKMDRTTANNLGRMMGIDQGTLNLLLQGRKELELEIQRQKEHSAVTKEQAAQAQKLQTQIAGVKQQFSALGRSLFMDAAPALEKLLDMFARFGDWIQGHKDFVEDFLKVLAVGLGAIALATLPITLTSVAILGLAAAIALLWEDYQTWKKGGDSLIDWGKWEPAITAATKNIEVLRKSLVGLWEIFEKISSKYQGLPDWAKKVLGITSPAIGALQGLSGSLAPSTKKFNAARDEAGGFASAEGFFDKGKIPNRPQRNHNPGDVEYGDFAIRHGATGSDGRFAIFPDDETGMAALRALLSSPGYAGLTTEQKIQKYAPSSENNTDAYIASVRQFLSGSNNGYAKSLSGVPGASSFAATAPGGTSGTTNVDKSIDVTIQKMEINIQATDAQGIANDFSQGLDYQFAAQANYGLN